MRKFFTTAFVMAAVMVLATSGLALEKAAIRDDDSRADSWTQATTCSVIYWNTCTGWLWVWTGWSPSDMVGVWSESACCGAGETASMVGCTQWFYYGNEPAGYGFTGSVEVWSADMAMCPLAPIASQPLLPIDRTNYITWDPAVEVTGPFVLMYVLGTAPGQDLAIGTDHPAAGPTGPQACGYCYPSPRSVTSFYYGNPTSVMCPGSVFNDDICDCELLFDSQFSCAIGVEESSWGTIKGLYR